MSSQMLKDQSAAINTIADDPSSTGSALISVLSSLSSPNASCISIPPPHTLRLDGDTITTTQGATQKDTYNDFVTLLNVLNRPPMKGEGGGGQKGGKRVPDESTTSNNPSDDASSNPSDDLSPSNESSKSTSSNVTNPKVASAIILHQALKKSLYWDPILLHLYCQDSIGSRVWVDDSDPDVRSFVSILEAR